MRRHNSTHLFRILDEVSRNGNVTQRRLSQRVGVALGLTNLYLKQLVKKGLIKVVNLKANRLRYELTPRGIAEKTTMALQYVQDSYVFYREARKSLTQTFERVRESGARSVVLYGAGDLAEIALLSLQEVQLVLAGVVSVRHAGQLLCGRPVYHPEAVSSMPYDRIVVVENEEDVAVKVLGDLGVSELDIVRVGR